MTVNIRSAKRLPAVVLSLPKLPLRQSTAGRRARSATLLLSGAQLKGSRSPKDKKNHMRAVFTCDSVAGSSLYRVDPPWAFPLIHPSGSWPCRATPKS